jgi:hypothetical protein
MPCRQLSARRRRSGLRSGCGAGRGFSSAPVRTLVLGRRPYAFACGGAGGADSRVARSSSAFAGYQRRRSGVEIMGVRCRCRH